LWALDLWRLRRFDWTAEKITHPRNGDFMTPRPSGVSSRNKKIKHILTSACELTAPGREDPLNFENGTVESIRSISQRGLTAAWARLASRGLPAFDQFHPETRVHDPKQLVAWKVEVAEDQFVFRALYRGPLVDKAFSSTWTGKTLAEVTPASLRPAIIGASDQCARTGCAIYTILRTYNDAGHPVDLERLLLPFGKNGRVQIIVASLQLISMEGTFERANVVKYFEAQAVIMVSLKISAASFNEARAKSVDVTISSLGTGARCFER
jgi:hypothetical protein